MIFRRMSTFVFMAAIGLAVGTVSAAADVIVLAAKGASLKPGDTLGDGASIDLPAGATAEILLPSGAMRTLTGPTKTSVRNLTKGEKADSGLFDKVTELVGKSGSTESSVGAVRAVTGPRGGGKPMPFSWNNVPVDADGDWCVEKGASIAFVRPSGDKPLKATLVDVAGSQRAEINFEAGKTSVPWPDTIAAKVGSYALLVADRPMKQLRLRLIAPVPTREETLRVLHGQRCEVQMRAFLVELTQVATR